MNPIRLTLTTCPLRFHVALGAALLCVALQSPALAGDPAAKAPMSPDLKATLGLDVGDRDDPVAKMMQLSGGLRVMQVDPGSVASNITFPGTHRAIGRGDFILRVRVKGIDTETDPSKDVIVSPDDFRKACARARRLAWEQPGHKATLIVDVHTQAGYNMEDWKDMSFEGPLDMSGEPEPPKLDAVPPAPKSAGGV